MSTTTTCGHGPAPETVTAPNNNDITYPDYNGMWMVTDDAQNPYIISGGMVYIRLTSMMVGVLDASDWDLVRGRKWHAYGRGPTFYCRADGGRRLSGHRERVLMHNVLSQPPAGLTWDHADRNGLNNTRGNLRACSVNQNAFNRHMRPDNSSGFRGVYWHSRSQRWCAKITANGKSTDLCYVKSPEEAARIRDRKAIELHGEFAVLNFPRETYAETLDR